MSKPSTLEGTLAAARGARFAIVTARFNHFVVDRLLEGAFDAFARHGVADDAIVTAKVPGSYEVPFAVKRFAASGKVDAVIALAAVIRGATPHFDFVAGEVAKGCGAVMHETGVPVIFGVLTTDTIEQALERAGTKAGNKGYDAAVAAIEMVDLRRAMEAAGY
ncbi:MAG: 6,7-dimethyl-8-ribityllumazine synthase [Sandaracinaceae bacterium]